jgi:hypothetical protein
MAMPTDAHEIPLLSTLDHHGNDRLLLALIAVHGAAGRPDIAPEITAAMRATARMVEEAAEMVPAA